MMRSARIALVAVLCWAAAPLVAVSARADAEVDVALVLAVDVSWSMDPDEQTLQRDGFVEAFRSPQVHDAIRRGTLGRIAVTYFEWAGGSHQELVAPWTVLEGPDDALAFADRLARKSPGRSYYTSISGALDFGVGLLADSKVDAIRRVIDVSGDGANNDGRPVTLARDAAVEKGIVINGLPIMLKSGSQAWDIANLDGYYRDCVIGGPGAFLVPVRERSQFATAIRTKLIREIADMPEAAPLIQPAQAEARANCMIGEALRRQRSWN